MKNFLILLISIILFSCNSDKGRSKATEPNLIDGFYKAEAFFKNDGDKKHYIWIISKQEINIFEYNENDYGDVLHQVSFKYYINSNKIYQCNCLLNDCLDKNKFEEFYNIVSNKIEDNQQTIILDNSIFKITLTKTKQTCLDVNNFKN